MNQEQQDGKSDFDHWAAAPLKTTLWIILKNQLSFVESLDSSGIRGPKISSDFSDNTPHLRFQRENLKAFKMMNSANRLNLELKIRVRSCQTIGLEVLEVMEVIEGLEVL